jgi:hypothetical protein
MLFIGEDGHAASYGHGGTFFFSLLFFTMYLMIVQDDLRIFHAKHFPHAPAPAQFVHGAEPIEELAEEYYGYDEEDDGLGYHPDGVKRTLTDEQIALFRHTEIQTIIRERIRKRENGGSPEPDPKQHSSGSTPSTGGDKVQDGRVEKGTNWTKISAKSRAKNSKRRKRYQASLKEKRKTKRQEDEESDEWDPWHQANGPDVQKDTPVDLDY